ncbi:MAG: hypothetical protein ACLFQB_12580 [Chitinispirillaceae bacterium]
MFKLKSVVTTALSAAFLVGCGNSGPDVKAGDKVVVPEELPREKINLEYSGGESDGVYKPVPEGTVLEVVITPKTASPIVELIPVEVEGEKDSEKVQDFFVPNRFSKREGFLAYTIPLKKEYFGTKVKKLE